MIRFKYIVTVAVGMALTILVIIVPDIVSANIGLPKFDSSEVWFYENAENEKDLTSAQVLKIYAYGQNLTGYTSDVSGIINATNKGQTKEKATEMFKSFFGASQPIWNHIEKELASDEVAFADKSTILTISDCRVIVLNVVNVCFSSGLEIVYEEKTGTVLEVRYTMLDWKNNIEYYGFYVDDVEKCAEMYFGAFYEESDIKYFIDVEQYNNDTLLNIGVIQATIYEEEKVISDGLDNYIHS